MKRPLYLLDTNICIALLQNKRNVRERIREIGLNECCVSEITIAELFYGASKSQRKKEQIKDVEKITQLFYVVSIYPALEVYGDIKAHLERAGTPIDDFDLLIGASAVQYDMIIVTGNIRHFQRIPKIKIENWM